MPEMQKQQQRQQQQQQQQHEELGVPTLFLEISCVVDHYVCYELYP